jgi:hypothetical protein
VLEWVGAQETVIEAAKYYIYQVVFVFVFLVVLWFELDLGVAR